MFLIVGANSEIGTSTARLIRARGQNVLATTRRMTSADEIQFDFRSSLKTLALPVGVKSACIFVAVARLAACEGDPAGSALVNVKQTIALIDHLVSRGIYTLFLSSNQVFSGDRPHVPADAPVSPISEYGRQKAEAESLLQARMAGGAPIGVLRLAKVVSPGMPLLTTWTRDLSAGRAIHAFSDMTLAPTPIDIVATTIVRMMEDQSPVIAQLTGPQDVAYADVGRFLANKIGADPRLVVPVSALEGGMPPGSAPRNTTLDSSYVATRYGLTVPDAFDVLGKL